MALGIYSINSILDFERAVENESDWQSIMWDLRHFRDSTDCDWITVDKSANNAADLLDHMRQRILSMEAKQAKP